MITVYFESNIHTEVVATFEDESIYELCIPVLEAEADRNGMILTKTVN